MPNLLKYKNREGEKGFTLIEAVISVLILGIVVGSMLGVFMVSKVSITNAKYYIEAMNLARARMEDLKNQAYSSIIRGTSSITVDYPYQISIESPFDDPPFVIDWGGDVDNDGVIVNEEDVPGVWGDGDELTGNRITQVEPIGSPEEYLKVIVTVTWSGYRLGGSSWQGSESLVTYISK